jgi:hypothetical protein
MAMITASSPTRAPWKARFLSCMLAAAALTAFLMHLGAADPWIGGIAVPATVWVAWMGVDIARAARRRARQRREIAQRDGT